MDPDLVQQTMSPATKLRNSIKATTSAVLPLDGSPPTPTQRRVTSQETIFLIKKTRADMAYPGGDRRRYFRIHNSQIDYCVSPDDGGISFPLSALCSVVLEDSRAADFVFKEGDLFRDRSSLRVLFVNSHERGLFIDAYHCLQQQRLHIPVPQAKDLSLLILTWNVGNSVPPRDLSALLDGAYDIIAFGAQEVSTTRKQQGMELRRQATNPEEESDSRPMATAVKAVVGKFSKVVMAGEEGKRGRQEARKDKKEGGKKKDARWIWRIRSHLQTTKPNEYREVVYVKMLQIRLVVFIREVLFPHLNSIDFNSVPTGVGQLGTKGAVGVCFTLGSQSFAFLCCHLAAHTEHSKIRAENYRKIMAEMRLGVRGIPLLIQFDHLFVFGDLNYRVDLEMDVAVDLLQKGNIAELLGRDQLSRTDVLTGLSEADVPTFMPTFKLAKPVLSSEEKAFGTVKVGKTTYLLQRVPSYTDRIFFRSVRAVKRDYSSVDDGVFSHNSDHVPVRAVFQIYGLELSNLTAPAPRACFLLLSSLAATSSNEPLGDHSALLTVSAPSLFLSSHEAFVPVGPPVPHIPLGSLALAVRANCSVPFVRSSKLFLSLTSSGGVLHGVAALRLDAAFSAQRVPFEVDLFFKSTEPPVGKVRGFVHGNLVE